MDNLMAASTQSDEILLDVLSELTTRVDVVNMKFVQSTTALAAPPVPLEDVLAQC
jgi:hypothetical protein